MNSRSYWLNRAVAMIALTVIVTALFSFDVFAENTYVRQLRNYSNSISTASLTYSVTAAQFGYVTESTLSGGMHSPVLITARLTNNGTNDVKIANSYIDLTFTTYSQVSAYDCYTSDLMVQMVKNGNDTPRYNIVASNGYSYGGHIVVPAHSSLYLVFEVDIEASYDTSSASVTSPSLDAVLLSISSSDVVTGDYPTTGSIPEQLDDLETYVAQVAGYTYANGQSIATITTILNDIKNQIRFTGTFVAPSAEAFSRKQVTGVTVDGNSGLSYNLHLIKYPSYLTSYAFEENNYTNTIDQGGFKRIVLQYNFEVISSSAFRFSTLYIYLPITVNNYVQPYIVDIRSNVFDHGYCSGNRITMQSSINHPTVPNNFLAPAGRSYAYITLYIDVPISTNIGNLDDFATVPAIFNNYGTYDGYVPFSVNAGIMNIYNGMSSSSSSDISSDSSSLNQTESQVHQQEQLYFAQNAQAIQNTGLSNYRFNTEQTNGITAVSQDFTSVWNSLGSWSAVYVFSLTLGVALTILRHAPNAITRSINRRKKENN